MDYQDWIVKCQKDIIEPRKRRIENHPFTKGMLSGAVEKPEAERFFSGLMWHLQDFGKHVEHLMKKRPLEASALLVNRSEDTDGDTEILKRIVNILGGSSEIILRSPYLHNPHPVWITHDALLRSAIYSNDFPWQAGTAALNSGIETLVPTMIEPLFVATTKRYGLSSEDAEWLGSRSGEAEQQHGENGWILLNHFVSPDDFALQALCRFQIDALSYSMAYRLLDSGINRNLI